MELNVLGSFLCVNIFLFLNVCFVLWKFVLLVIIIILFVFLENVFVIFFWILFVWGVGKGNKFFYGWFILNLYCLILVVCKFGFILLLMRVILFFLIMVVLL